MAHNIHFDKLSQQHAFYASKQRAWHGLGQVVSDAVTPLEAMELAHLDYIVGIKDCFIELPSNVPNVPGYDKLLIPNVKATYRTDTNTVFGVVGNRYTPVQNDQFLDFIYDVFKRPDMFGGVDIIIETAGALGKGERVFVTAKVPNYVKLLSTGDDIAESYILVTTSHDGSDSFTAGLTDIRVVCNNTLNAAIPGLVNKVTFKHTMNIKTKLQTAASIMNIGFIHHEKQRECFDYMFNKQVKEETVISYLADLMLNANQRDALKDNNWKIVTTNEELLNPKSKNKLYDIINWIDKGAGQDNEEIRGSVYWLYQGVNGYLNNGAKYSNNEDRFTSLITGTASKINQRALELAINLV